jgi:hypothetical protein
MKWLKTFVALLVLTALQPWLDLHRMRAHAALDERAYVVDKVRRGKSSLLFLDVHPLYRECARVAIENNGPVLAA